MTGRTDPDGLPWRPPAFGAQVNKETLYEIAHAMGLSVVLLRKAKHTTPRLVEIIINTARMLVVEAEK